jgi:hypothetical protein
VNTNKNKGTRKSGENKQPKDKIDVHYTKRSYETLMRGNGQNVDVASMQSLLTQNKSGASFLAHKMNNLNFMN